jgi:hypothetical protein
MGDALAGVPAADFVGRIELHFLMLNKDHDIGHLHVEAFAKILLLAERAENNPGEIQPKTRTCVCV